MMWGPDPGRSSGPDHPPQVEAAKQAAVAKEAEEENNKVGLLDGVLVHLFTCVEEIAGSRGVGAFRCRVAGWELLMAVCSGSVWLQSANG